MLLGVDEEKKEIACGLVDTIGINKFHDRKLTIFLTKNFFTGSYTFAKTLEYKAKQGLQSGKEVTVVPPTEYQDRFVNVLEGYFIACPGQLFVGWAGCVQLFKLSHTQLVSLDKWSKPLDETNVISDPNLLPSVL